MSLETVSIESLSNKFIQQFGNSHIKIPSSFQLESTDNTSITLRVRFVYLILELSVFCLCFSRWYNH